MMLYISMKFHENIFNGFQVTEQTQFCDTPKDRQDGQTRVMALVVCMSPDDVLYFYDVSGK